MSDVDRAALWIEAVNLNRDLVSAIRYAGLHPRHAKRQQAIWAALLDRTLVAEVAW